MPTSKKPEMTIVVPCFNEADSVVNLHEQLRSARPLLETDHRVHLILVDDGSTDSTWSLLHQLFSEWPDCTLIQQSTNLGVSTAILTGISAAKTEIVCSMDCDCTYAPSQFTRLLPALTSEVALVTGSPYHPDGRVLGVPRWRHFLSKTASALYRLVLNQSLYTYTSCFRVYRRSAVLQVPMKRRGFLGVTELIGKLDLLGFTIAEYPTTLTSRTLGHSKMKTMRVLFGHLRLLCELLALRARQMLFNALLL